MTSEKQKIDTELNDKTLSSSRTCHTCGMRLAESVTACPKDGTPVVEEVKPGSLIAGKYEFIDTIGAGGMGVIYKARLPALDKLVAIKMMHMHLMSGEAAMRFQQEGKAASHLSHTNIVSVHDLGLTEDGQPYMVMDYVEGSTVAEQIAKLGALQPERAIKIFLQVCDAITHAHENGVLHRDLKPSNIMIVNAGGIDESVKILDFGIAKILEADHTGKQNLTRTGETLGSPLYMSPEQALGKKVDRRSDIYSMGCVMFECLTGTPPFVGNTIMDTMLKHMNDTPPSLKEASMGREIPEAFETVIAKALSKEPDARYQTMDDLKQDLLLIQKGLTPLAQPFVSVIDTRKAPKAQFEFSPLFLLLVVAGVGVFAIALFTLFPRKSADVAPRINADFETTLSVAPKNVDSQDDKSINDPDDVVIAMLAQRPTELKSPRFYRLTARGMRAIGEARQLSKLSLESAVSNQDLAYLKNLPHLTWLDLEGNHIDHRGFSALSSIKALRHLSLADAVSNQEDLKLLYELPQLEWLDLRKNENIDDQGMAILARIKTLRDVDVKDTKVSVAAIRSFVSKNPHCSVSSNWSDKVFHTAMEGNKLLNAKRIAQAIKVYETAVPIADEIGGPTARSLFASLGQCYFEEKQYAKAETAFRKAAQIEEKLGRKPGEYIQYLLGVGNCCFFQNKLEESEKFYKKAIDAASRLPDNDKQVAEIMTIFANTLMLRGAAEEAYPYSRKALQIVERLYPNRDEAALSMGPLGICCSSTGRFKEGEELLVKALKIWYRKHPNEGRHAPVMEFHLANCLEGMNRWAEAEPHFRKAVQLGAKEYGKTAIYTDMKRRLELNLAHQGKGSQ
ncbi:MAG TPA: protein kinase [Candidatus Obscuribacterales bacterium]